MREILLLQSLILPGADAPASGRATSKYLHVISFLILCAAHKASADQKCLGATDLGKHIFYTGFITFVLTIGVVAFGQEPAGKTPVRTPAPAQPRRVHRAPAYPKRPPAPPAQLAHGKQLFEANCSFCHGSDARGGETGPNLVRAQLVLDDQNGELIAPIVRNGIPGKGMPKFDLSTSDIAAIAAFLHHQPLSNRGAPSKLDILVGNARAGQAYFDQHCTSCHSVTGDLAGIGGKYDPKTVQNLIVSGGANGGRSRRKGPPLPKVPPTTVTVTLPSGKSVEGKLDHLTAFVVGLTEADGTYRSFLRNGEVPKVVVHYPLQWHLDMLPRWGDTDIHNLTSYLVTLK
jgi:mono/diheme cytochrome c family protein